MKQEIRIGERIIGNEHPVYIVAEMSANHNMDFDRAKEIIYRVKEAGADAVKIQTYTADTITLDCDNEYFQIKHGTLWDGTTLHKLYQKAYTPWEWQKDLYEYAKSLDIELFSSPFDGTAVDFLETFPVNAYKIASFEINDIPLIRKIARLGKPIIFATGIAYLEDIDLAVRSCLEENNNQIILLKCTSAYPTPYEEVNLNALKSLSDMFGCTVGISDHTMGATVPIASVALGAKMIEKHVTLKRSDGGEDSAFSMEIEEFSDMCKQVRIVEKALGNREYHLSKNQEAERHFSRSLFVVKDVKKGEIFTNENVRSIRPGEGLHTKYTDEVIGKVAKDDIAKGSPMKWEYIE